MAPKVLVNRLAICISIQAILLHLQLPYKLIIKNMAKRTMAQVMTQSSDSHISNFFFGYF